MRGEGRLRITGTLHDPQPRDPTSRKVSPTGLQGLACLNKALRKSGSGPGPCPGLGEEVPTPTHHTLGWGCAC